MWDELTDITQANLLEMLGGKRNSNVIAALIENFDIAEEVVSNSANAAGSALAENEKYLDSIGGKLAQFRASFEALSSSTISSNLIKGVIGFGTVAIDTLTSIIDNLGTIPTLLTAIGGILGKMGKKSILSPFSFDKDSNKFSFNIDAQLQRDIKAVEKYNEAINEAIKSGKNLSKGSSEIDEIVSSTMEGASASTLNFVKAQNGANVSTKELIKNLIKTKASTIAATAATTALNAAWSMGISLLIQGVIVGISKLITYQEDLAQNIRETADEIETSYHDASEEISSNLDTVKGLQDEFNSLSQGVDTYGNNISLSTDEYARYKEIVSEIVGISPSLISGYDKEGKAIANKNSLIERSIELLEQEQKARLQQYLSYDSLTKLGKGVRQDIIDFTKENSNIESDGIKRFSNAFSDAVKNALDNNPNITVEGIFDSIGVDSEKYFHDLETTLGFPVEPVEYVYAYVNEYYEEIKKGVLKNRDNLLSFFSQNDISLLEGIISDTDIGVANYNSELERLEKSFNSTLQMVPSLVNGYDDMTDAQKNFIAAYINGFSVTEDTTDEEFASMSSDIENFTRTINSNSNLGDTINQLLSIDPNTVSSVEDYENAVLPLISKISEGLNKTDDEIKSILNYDSVIAGIKSHINEINKEIGLVKGSFYKKVYGSEDMSDELGTNLFENASKFIENFRNNLEDTESEFGHFSQWIDNLSFDDKQLVYEISLVEDTSNLSLDQWKQVVNEVKTDGKLFDELKVKVQAVKDVLNGEINFQLNTETSGIENLNSALEESVSASGLTSEAIAQITNRYQELSSFDPEKLFEKTANGIHLNRDALRELEAEYESLNKEYLNTALDEQIEKYNELTIKISECTDTQERANLISQQNTLADEIEQTAILATQYEGLTSAYKKWMDARSSPDEGDMYDNVRTGLGELEELYEQGGVGSDDFRAGVQFMTDEDVSGFNSEQLVAAYEESLPAMNRYFTEGKEGVENFLKDLSKLNVEGKEFAKLNEDGTWEFNLGFGDDENIAKELGISVEAVQAILRKANWLGADLDLDYIFSDLGLLEDKFVSANEKLKELGKTDIDFNVNSNDINELDSQIKEAETLLDTFRNEDGSVNLDIEGAQEAQLILAGLIQQKQSLNTPAVMKVDVSNATSEAEQAVQKLQQFYAAYNNLQIDIAIGADTTESQSEVNGLFSEIQKLNPSVTASLGIDATSEESLVASIQNLTPQIMVDAGVNPEKVNAFVETEHKANGTVDWENNSEVVDSFIRNIEQNGAIGYVHWKNDTKNVKTSFTVPGTIRFSQPLLPIFSKNNSGSGGARGTAFQKGTWGTKTSGTALGGELGQELVVRDGKFFTIGDNGAELFHFEKDDIIFNADQTKQIFEKGKITSGNRRGKALADGTAFSSGSIKFYGSNSGNSTSFKVTQSSSNKTPSVTYSPNKQSYSNKSSSSSSTNKSNDSSDKIPWEDILKEYQHLRKMELITDQEYYEKLHALTEKYYSTRGNYLDDYRSLLEEEFQLARELSEDWFNDQEHQISLLERNNAPKSEQIELYRQMQEETHRLAEEARKYGLDENSDYIQSLQNQWWEYEDNIKELINEIYEEAQEKRENYLSLLENQNEVLVSGGYTYKSIENLERQREEQLEIQRAAHEEAERLRALGVDENDEAIQACISAWWDAENNIRSINQQITDTILGEYDELISYMDDFDLWDNDNLSAPTKLDYLEEKLAKIKELYEAGVLSYQEYVDLTNETALDIYNLKKDAIDEIIDKTMEMIKQEKEDQIEALEEQIDKYSEIIDLKKESLELEKEEEDYRKSVEDKIKEIASLESRINQLKLDDSREATAERIALEEELAEKNEELADYQRDYQYDAQMDALDKSADAFSESKEEEIKVVEESIDSTTKLYNLAIERIDKGWDQLYTDLMAWNEKYGDGIDGANSITSAWKIAQQAAEDYRDTLTMISSINIENGINPGTPIADTQSALEKMKQNSLDWYISDPETQASLISENASLAASISKTLGETLTNVNGVWQRQNGTPLYTLDDDEIISHIVNAMKANANAWQYEDSSGRQTLENENERLAGMISNVSNESVYRDANGVWWIGNRKLFDSYHSGGIAGNQPTLEQNEMLAVLEKGEPVLDKTKETTLYRIIDFTEVLSKRLGKVLDSNVIQSLTGQLQSITSSIFKPQNIAMQMLPSQTMSLSPVINVTINHSGEMTKMDAFQFGQMVAENTLSELTNAFHKRGFGWRNEAALK